MFFLLLNMFLVMYVRNLCLIQRKKILSYVSKWGFQSFRFLIHFELILLYCQGLESGSNIQGSPDKDSCWLLNRNITSQERLARNIPTNEKQRPATKTTLSSKALHFFLFYILCESSGIFFFGYHEVCIKCLIDKMVLVLCFFDSHSILIHSTVQILSFPLP